MNFITLIIWFFNKLFLQSTYNSFLQKLKEPAKTQQKLLKTLLQDLSQTEYGKQYKISSNHTFLEFNLNVPIIVYEDLKSFIAKMQKQNQPNILTTQKPIYWETTSGSTSYKKLIPYNSNLLQSFENAFKIWVSDLILGQKIKLQKAKIFFSISPVSAEFYQENKTNFKSDFEYLGKFLHWVLKFFVINIPITNNLNSFQEKLSLCLLEEENLEIISIWSPSYLLAILDYIKKNFLVLLPQIKKSSRREKLLVLSKQKSINWQKVWPNLQLISCWTSAGAINSAKYLASLFPKTRMQGKGLLCTEAPLTIPIGKENLYLPLITEVFFEFLDSEGNIKLVENLEIGNIYELIISQKGGLFRYKNGDLVKCIQYFKNTKTPCLEFIGRSNKTIDLVGEKLTEHFINSIFYKLNREVQNENKFNSCSFLLPFSDGKTVNKYFLIVEKNITNNTFANLNFAKNFEKELRKSHHYNLARSLNQISQLELKEVKDLLSKVQVFFSEYKQIKIGDLKDFCLIADLNLADKLLEILN